MIEMEGMDHEQSESKEGKTLLGFLSLKCYYKHMKIWRGAVLLAGIGVLAIGAALWLTSRVQQTIAPEDDTPVVVEGEGGAPELDRHIMLDKLTNVWDVAFLPDDTLLFTERAGTISKLVDGQRIFMTTVPNIYAQGEGGLLGLTVDRNFGSNRFIYACYNTRQDIRVSRWKVTDNNAGLTDKTDIVTGMPVNTTTFPGRHSGCRLRFGADSYLWIGTGDVGQGASPQDPKSLGGKILRVDRNGQPAPDNLGGDNDPRIYSIGHRNVQGLAMLEIPRLGIYGYSVEHGPDKHDEVNALVRGNFGWDPVPGAYNEAVPMTDKTKFPLAIDAIWDSGSSTIAPSGMTFIKGAKWKGFNGRLAMAVLKGKQVRLLEIDGSGKLKSEQVLFDNEFGRIRSAVMGPNDDLYLTTDNGGGQDKIIRISPR